MTEPAGGLAERRVGAGKLAQRSAQIDALSGLDMGEKIIWPSVAEATRWDKYDAARSALFAATRTGKPAPRYNLA
jgi:hypothetical protein